MAGIVVRGIFDDDEPGFVPASGGGTTNFLRADGTWASAGGGGAPLTDGDKGDITVSSSGAVWNIDANAVGATEIAADAVTTAKILDLNVTTGKLAANAVTTAKITDANVTLAKIANIATSRLLGRVTASSGVVEELTGTQVTTLLDVFTSVLKGLVPASGGGTVNFLRADATWAVPTSNVFFGDGSDGDVTIAAGTTTLTRTMYYNNLTIDSGAILASAGFPIHVKGILTFTDSTSVISRIGNPGADATPTASGAAAATLTGGIFVQPGVNAGAGGSPPSGASGNVLSTYQGCTATGGAGGRGNFHAGGSGSTIGSTLAATSGDMRTAQYAINSRTSLNTAFSAISGAGGGGGAAQFSNQSYGGGGGGGGGWQVVCAKSIVHTSGTGKMTAAGGGGGSGNVHATGVDVGGGGGGGGGGGVNVLVYNSGTLPTIVVQGGIGGAAVNTGTPVTPALAGTGGGAGLSLVFVV